MSEITMLFSTELIASKLFDLFEKNFHGFSKIFINSYFTNSEVWLTLFFTFAQNFNTNISLFQIYFFLSFSSVFKNLFFSFDIVIIALCNSLCMKGTWLEQIFCLQWSIKNHDLETMILKTFQTLAIWW